jgi:hypothetical protein
MRSLRNSLVNEPAHMRYARHLPINEHTKTMLQLKKEPCVGEKGRARKLIILLSLRNVRSHGAYSILILPCSSDVGNKLYQNHELTEANLTP